MTLPNGQISMSQVNTELGNPSSSQISLNDSDVRSLAGKQSGQIRMSDLQGASNFSASGGETGVRWGKKFHIFTSTGTFTFSGSKTINYIGIGGGGGASNNNYDPYNQRRGNAGGGAGGYAEGSTSINGPGSLTITVGSGGNQGPTTGNGGNGSASKIGPSIKFGGGGGGGYTTGQTDPLGLGGGGGGGVGNMVQGWPGNPSSPNSGGSGGSQAGNGSGGENFPYTINYPWGPYTTIRAVAGGGGGAYGPQSPNSDSNARPAQDPNFPGHGGRGARLPHDFFNVIDDNNMNAAIIFAPGGGAPSSYSIVSPAPGPEGGNSPSYANSPLPGGYAWVGYGGNSGPGGGYGGSGGAGKGGDSNGGARSNYMPQYWNSHSGCPGFVCIYYPV